VLRIFGTHKRGNAREYLLKDKVRLKKYFYVLRPLLAIRCIAELLSLKRTMPELGLGEPIEAINDLIEHESERHGQSYQGQGRPDLLDRQDLRDQLNALFRIAISEAFH
jgi:uncharacterized protein